MFLILGNYWLMFAWGEGWKSERHSWTSFGQFAKVANPMEAKWPSFQSDPNSKPSFLLVWDAVSLQELRSHYGSSIDRVKPYFEAAATFRCASERVHATGHQSHEKIRLWRVFFSQTVLFSSFFLSEIFWTQSWTVWMVTSVSWIRTNTDQIWPNDRKW